MSLYHLACINDGKPYSYDAKIVRAESAEQARNIANEDVGDERHIWTDESKVTCERLTEDGELGVILASFNAG